MRDPDPADPAVLIHAASRISRLAVRAFRRTSAYSTDGSPLLVVALSALEFCRDTGRQLKDNAILDAPDEDDEPEDDDDDARSPVVTLRLVLPDDEPEDDEPEIAPLPT